MTPRFQLDRRMVGVVLKKPGEDQVWEDGHNELGFHFGFIITSKREPDMK